jgi:hypothetical protein
MDIPEARIYVRDPDTSSPAYRWIDPLIVQICLIKTDYGSCCNPPINTIARAHRSQLSPIKLTHIR